MINKMTMTVVIIIMDLIDVIYIRLIPVVMSFMVEILVMAFHIVEHMW